MAVNDTDSEEDTSSIPDTWEDESASNDDSSQSTESVLVPEPAGANLEAGKSVPLVYNYVQIEGVDLNEYARKLSQGKYDSDFVRATVDEFRSTFKPNNPAHRRITRFVMLPVMPLYPAAHPGSDDRIHPGKGMDPAMHNLLELARSTMNFLKHKYPESTVSSSPIVMRGSFEDDPVERELMAGDTALLSTHSVNIGRELQHALELHVAGHGSCNNIGSQHTGDRLSPEAFAVFLDYILDSSDLKSLYTGENEREFKVEFHTCNSAFFEVLGEPSAATVESISSNVMHNSFIGRFYNKMKELGYANIVVAGYRGYYSTMDSGAGARVQESNDNTKKSKEHDALSARYVIRNDTVELPSGNVDTLLFPVNLPRHEIAAYRSNYKPVDALDTVKPVLMQHGQRRTSTRTQNKTQKPSRDKG